MDLRPAPALLDGSDVALVTGIIAGSVELSARSGEAAAPPDWIKVTPRGRVATRDGRSFDFDPAVLAARFRADAIDLPVDTDHSTVHLGARGEKPHTIGYATAVEARDDGTYAKVDWNDAGRATLAARSHRYVSPTVYPDSTGRATWLHSVALVSAPALSMPAVLHVTQGNPMKDIAKALGLAETATEAECLAALGRLTERAPLISALGLPAEADAAALLSAVTTLRVSGANGTAADKAIIATLQTDLRSTSDRLAQVIKTGRDRDVAELLDGATRERRMLPAERDSLIKLCVTDDGLTHVRAMLASRVPGLGPSGLDGLTPPTGDGAVDPVTLGAQARALVDKGDFPDVIAAVNHLTKKKA